MEKEKNFVSADGGQCSEFEMLKASLEQDRKDIIIFLKSDEAKNNPAVSQALGNVVASINQFLGTLYILSLDDQECD